MKKKIIIASIIIITLLIILCSAHMFVLLNPRFVIVNAIESIEWPEWFENVKSDFYELNAELFGKDTENQDFHIGASAITNIKEMQLGGDIVFDYQDESTAASFFADKENVILSPDFYMSSVIVAEDCINIDNSTKISIKELLNVYYECIKSGKCDDLFSAKRDNLTVLDKEFCNKSIISLYLTDDEVKTLCDGDFDKNTDSFDISAKFDIILGFYKPVALKAEIDIQSADYNITKHTILLEITFENDLQSRIIVKSENSTNTFFIQATDNEDVLNITASAKHENSKETGYTATEFYYTETENGFGNGKIEVFSFCDDTENAKIHFSLPFEYSHREKTHNLSFKSFELKYGGVIFNPSFDITLEASTFDYGFDIKINSDFKFKKYNLDFELNLSIAKAYGFDRVKPENAVLLNKQLKDSILLAFCEQNPETAEFFGLATQKDAEDNISDQIIDFFGSTNIFNNKR